MIKWRGLVFSPRVGFHRLNKVPALKPTSVAFTGRNTLGLRPRRTSAYHVSPMLPANMTRGALQGGNVMKRMQQQVVALPPVLLDRLERWQPAVKKILDFGKAASEVKWQNIVFNLSMSADIF